MLFCWFFFLQDYISYTHNTYNSRSSPAINRPCMQQKNGLPVTLTDIASVRSPDPAGDAVRLRWNKAFRLRKHETPSITDSCFRKPYSKFTVKWKKKKKEETVKTSGWWILKPNITRQWLTGLSSKYRHAKFHADGYTARIHPAVTKSSSVR